MMGYGWTCPGLGASGYGGWGLVLTGLFWLLLVVGIVALVVWAVRRPAYHGAVPATAVAPSRALEIARERYARGEITRDEFRRTVDDLR